MSYDAVLVLSFGGPESRADVMPFLENVLRGKPVPRPRMLEVADHYYRFEGRSPINDQTRALIAALESEMGKHGPRLPVYWGNRNWHPLLADTVRKMEQDGVRRALAFVTSAYSSYSGCRQYLEDIARARALAGPGAPMVEKLRVFFNHPGFIAALVERAQEALMQVPSEIRARVPMLYTAHSVPVASAQTSQYVSQLEETVRLVSKGLGRSGDPLVYQSRSGPPGQAWLAPDILDYLRAMQPAPGGASLVIVPVGFISDHMEVLYDLDTEARGLCSKRGILMVRAATVGTHPLFIRMIRDLILERVEGTGERRTLGALGPGADFCPPDCCLPPKGRVAGG
ncbi:MAG TPA: ferrochelatase [Terriglobia bacterium]|nr:ferrochelatase [Terriglobia bacterium]